MTMQHDPARMTTQAAIRRLARTVLAALFLWMALPVATQAQPAPTPTPAAEPAPAKVKELLDLLADPGVRDWLAKQRTASPATPKPAEAPPMSMGARIGDVRTHIAGLAAAVPTVPGQLERAGDILMLELEEQGLLRVLLLIVGFVVLGIGVEWLYYKLTARVGHWIVALPLNSVEQRLRAVAVRLAYGIGIVAAFAIGSVGAFLLFAWPPLLGEIVLRYLVAFLAIRLTLVASRFVLAPGGERFRILPMPTRTAYFWHRRLGVAVAWLAVGWVTVAILGTLGISPDARRIIAYALGLGLLAMGIAAVWRRPRAAADTSAALRHGRFGGTAIAALLSAYFVALWLLWVSGAMPLFWLAVVVVALPLTMAATERAVNHILRPADVADADTATPGIYAVSLGRGLRALLIFGAVLLLARAWDVDLAAMTAGDALTTRLLRGALNVVVIGLVADFAWHVMKAVIDHKLGAAQTGGPVDDEDAGRRARLRTLLPILRNVVAIVLGVMAVLMALASAASRSGRWSPVPA